MKAVLTCFALLAAHVTYADPAPAKPQPTMKVDGLFQGWNDSQLGWKETGAAGFGPLGTDVDAKEFYHSNDKNFLYLFFKTSPTVEEWYAQHKKTGAFACLYIDSDANAETGAPDKDGLSGNKAMIGADIQIWVPLGFFFESKGDETKRSGATVSYRVHLWNPESKDFDVEAAEYSSNKSRLIAHGADGIEMAIPLGDLRKCVGDKFDFICIEWANAFRERNKANRISITLK